MWLVLQLGAGCSAGLEENHLVPTPPVSDPANYCTLIVDDSSIPDLQVTWSSDGERYACVDSGCGIVVDTAQNRTWSRPIPATFWRWTTDSRYAIFRYQNAKGNTMTYVFDAVMWEFERTQGCPDIHTGYLLTWVPYGDYPLALAPNAPRFLMENGSLVDLPGLQKIRLPVHWDADHLSVLVAEWSPNGGYLAFVAGRYPSEGGTLYLAHGDGTWIQQSVSFEGSHTLQWATDGTSVIVETAINRYVLDTATRQVEVVSKLTSP
jgi:hypothetical protein